MRGTCSASPATERVASMLTLRDFLVRGLLADESNRLFVGTMIQIAHNLKVQTVAEHVEDAA